MTGTPCTLLIRLVLNDIVRIRIMGVVSCCNIVLAWFFRFQQGKLRFVSFGEIKRRVKPDVFVALG